MSEFTAEQKLRELIALYEEGAGIKAMISDLANFLESRSSENQVKLEGQEEKDEYLAESIEIDSEVSAALYSALDEVGY